MERAGADDVWRDLLATLYVPRAAAMEVVLYAQDCENCLEQAVM